MARSRTPKPQPKTVHDGTVLLVRVPRSHDQAGPAAERLLTELHNLLLVPKTGLLKRNRRERLGLEIAKRGNQIGFYVWVPRYLKDHVARRVYARYPMAHISEAEDYAARPQGHYPTQLVTELQFAGPGTVRTLQHFDADPLSKITEALHAFGDDEEAWVQLLVRPARRRAARGGGAQQPAFETLLRIIYSGAAGRQQAQLRLQSVLAAYKHFHTAHPTDFKVRPVAADPMLVQHYRARTFDRPGRTRRADEIAALYHPPHASVTTPSVLRAGIQTAEPPSRLPLITPGNQHEVSPMAATRVHGQSTMFGLPRSDRSRHVYVTGQAGTGKSSVLELLAISDAYSPYGFAVIDPRGDLAQAVLARIPAERAADVIYFNPADLEYPIGLNPLEVSEPKLKNHTAAELVDILKYFLKITGEKQCDEVLRYTVLALMDCPGATLLDVPRMLTDKQFRTNVLQHVTSTSVRGFWTIEFAGWKPKAAAEAVAPIVAKVGAAMADPCLRGMFGQPRSGFSMRGLMDERKILIANLDSRKIGEHASALLGSLLLFQVRLAAMSRTDTPTERRVPFHVYVDESHDFTAADVAPVLHDARRYGVGVTLAGQPWAGEANSAVLDTAGTVIALRMDAASAEVFRKRFGPEVTAQDLQQQPGRQFVVSMTVEGAKLPAFSAVSLNLPRVQNDCSAQIVERSRLQHARPRYLVEQAIAERLQPVKKVTARRAQPKLPVPTPAAPAPSRATSAAVPAHKPRRSRAKQPVAKPVRIPIFDVETEQTLGVLPEPEPPKPKRTRRRRRRTAADTGGTTTAKVARAIKEGALRLG